MPVSTRAQQVSLEALSIGRELALRGARTSVIEVLAGLTQSQARDMIRQVTGKDPKSGLLPICAGTMLANRRRHAEISIAATFYDRFRDPDDPSLSARSLIAAWDTYNLVTRDPMPDGTNARRPLTITELYVLARDMRVGTASLKRCQVCWNRWLYAATAKHYAECPHCALLTQTCRCGAVKGPKAKMCPECKSKYGQEYDVSSGHLARSRWQAA